MYTYIGYFEIVSFIASLLAWPAIKKNAALRLYPLLLFIVVTVETYEGFLRHAVEKNNAWIYNVQVPLQYLLYFAILFNAISEKWFKKIIIVSSIMFVIVTVVTQIYFTRKGSFNSWSYSLGSVIVIISILHKFREMVQGDEWANFIRNPFFYMLFAFLVFNIGTLPYFTMANWLWFHENNRNAVILLQNIMSILNYLVYSAYTIAFLWMIKKDIY